MFQPLLNNLKYFPLVSFYKLSPPTNMFLNGGWFGWRHTFRHSDDSRYKHRSLFSAAVSVVPTLLNNNDHTEEIKGGKDILPTCQCRPVSSNMSKKKKKMPLGWNWSYQTVDHLRNHSVIIWQVNSVVSCFLRSTAASSSTVKRWWTSTSTAWSSPCRPTRSTSSTAPRSRMRSKASSSGRPGGSGAAASRATVTNITTVFGVCITRRRVRGRRGTMASVCRKMSLPARRCTPQSTSLRCSRTASSSHKCTVLPLHREDVTCNSAHCRLQSWVSCDRSDWLKPRRYSHPKTFSYRLKRFK